MILHIDLNSYFATVEQQANPFLRGKPIGVAGKNISRQRTVVAAASIEAKRFGVKSGMSVWEARELCPTIILVEADYDRYLECSQRFYRTLERYNSRIEIFSIDEAFLELTDPNLQIRSECSECSGHSDGNSNYSDRCITIALAIKADIQRALGSWVTASIGIAPNKFLAKLASESNKPDGLTVIVARPAYAQAS